MASKRTLFFCFIVVSISVLVLSSEGLPTSHSLYHRLQKRSYMKLCGRMLVEALAAVCQSEYYGPYFKRNEEYVADSDQKWDDSASPDGMLDPQSALEFFSMNQITRRGVADECCMKSCSLHQLISYCGSNPKK